MDDFDFIEDDDLDINAMFDNQDDIPLDDEFIRTHFNTIPDGETIQNFPFVEDDVDAITDYELFSKGFGYLEDKKADKEELSEYVKKDEIPPLDDFVTKDTTELENYTLTEDLSEVALTGDYDDLSNKPTIPVVPTNVSAFTNDSGYITKDVNNLTNYTLTSSLSSVATSGDYDDLSNKPTIPTKTSDLTNDSGFITKDVNNLTNYTLTSNLSTVATSGSYNDLTNKPTIPDVSNFITKDVNDLTYYTLSSNLASVATSGSYNDLSNKPTIPPTMTILSYGNSTWNDFINAYNSKTIVYCRASSNSNPASGSQTRMAFMAYVNNADNPTEVEFQYYRSVSSHSDSQQGDQVFVYKLTSSGTWTVTTRNAFTKIVAGTNLSSSYSSGTLTINNTLTVPTKTSDLTNDSGFITKETNDLTNYTLTSSLSSVATSGSYNDLSNKPTIPINNDYAVLNGKQKNISGNTAWTQYSIAFNSNDEFSTNNSNLFEFNSEGIKCKFSGAILIIRAFTLNAGLSDKEIDIVDDYRTYYLTRGVNKTNYNIKTVSNNEIVKINYVGDATSLTIYNSRIIVIRL